MFIPVASGVIYSVILGCDFSPNYSAWLPSRTLRSTIALVTGAVFLAALLPALPGADVMTSGSGLDCAWTNYMQWKVIYNNPDVFTWVTDMDDACTVWKAADGLCWVLFLGWLLEIGLYMRAAKRASPLPEVPMADMKQKY
jgi:hypothetical protein